FALSFHYITDFGSSLPVVGASGAVSGILGAYLVLLPHMKIKAIGFYTLWKLPTYVIIGSWFVLQLVLAFISVFTDWSNVAFWAHVGGFVFGAMIGFIYNKHLWVKLVKRYRK
ncbi:MAG: rhomboid family intramembrane serine protease, partial [Candidatus Aenigmarchaeota archaeon]|nr:rhomboid family intramembrane serine protease [Candidatus Aenigmarchaeota archaeon]